jgi:proteasome-associated ATPase
MAHAEFDQRLAETLRQLQEQQAQVKLLEDEVSVLRRRLQDAPRRMHVLEQRLQDARSQLAQAASQNEKLSATLREARDQIAQLRDEVEKLTQPPNGFGVFIGANEDGSADVWTAGRKMRVGVHPSVDIRALRRGEELVLNESLNVIESRGYDLVGEVVTLKELIDDGTRAIVVVRADEERVVQLADSLLSDPEVRLRAGDSLLLDVKANLLIEKLARPEVEELVLEEVPDISYDDVGGLGEQIEAIQDAVELPYIHHDLFAAHKLKPPKGVLLYGPPGCGKTLIAKAVANSLAKKVAEVTKNANARSYFLNVKGPELLNKYVGETERQIRLIFQRAREKSQEGVPVIVFFDEMDSLFRMRGSGISSDIESTIVPQLLSEIDGVETLKNVIVIGASNREDLIDPAILRPGRLDVKIKIYRPDERAAVEIFGKYLVSDLPLDATELDACNGDPDACVARMISRTVAMMYAENDDTRFLEVTYANGDKETLYFKDFASGAMIENIVARAKKMAIKRTIRGEGRGLRTEDLLDAIQQEFKEHEDLPNTTNPDDWAKISGKKGERIVYVRTLIADKSGVEGGKFIDTVNTGQYL